MFLNLLSILFVVGVSLIPFLSASTITNDDNDDRGQYSALFTKSEYEKIKQKRIRKEIRDISDGEWTHIVNAMQIMKYVPDDVGQKIFGNKYINYDSLVCQHARTNLHSRGDMGHRGPSFNIWHRAFLLSFENSLIAIDPQIEGVPYWDFRRDIIEQNDSVDLTNSIIFSDKYFGDYSTVNHENRDYAVKNGEFAYWPINNNPSELKYECTDFYQNAFGLLRNRDNIEGNPYVTRYGGSVCGSNEFSFGDIDVYNYCLNNITDYAEFIDCYDFDVHGRAHVGIGGTRAAYNGQSAPEYPLCQYWHSRSWTKEIKNTRKWAQKYECFECPTPGSCSYDALNIDGAFECAMCNLTNNSNMCNMEGYILEILGEREEQNVVGDFVDQSTSPNDPIFIFHHANVDRYSVIWELRNYDQSPYYNYPTSGYEYGYHLDDILSDEAPFTNLFDNELIGNGPYTIRDIWDGTTIIDASYTYDTILHLIEQPQDSQTFWQKYEMEIIIIIVCLLIFVILIIIIRLCIKRKRNKLNITAYDSMHGQHYGTKQKTEISMQDQDSV